MQEKIRDTACCLFAADVMLPRIDALAQEREGVLLAEDSECIHRMRVASRRLRAALAIFAGCLPRKKADAWQQDIRRITRALGAARDCDVQIACVDTFLASCAGTSSHPGAARLLLRLRQQRTALQPRVVRALDRLREDRVLDGLAAALLAIRAAGRQGDAARSPALFALAASVLVQRLADLQAYETYVSQPECRDELHAMRIAAKRLRYTMEIFAPLYPGELKAPLKTVKTLQEQLGDLHDGDVWLQALPALLEEERRRTIAYLGHTRGFTRLASGIKAFEEDRRRQRQQSYAAFVETWAGSAAAWEALKTTVELTR
jgi:CHAD domain-containing protein